ncbi:hypothetical protein F5X97DRAFT_323495 [Nemania serpens]|nr:hypothetical protein F5X97DRAFT_323495 [Nemania serpens]
MPLNRTTSTSTSTEPNTPSIEPDATLEARKIPVAEVTCLGEQLSPANSQAAKEAMIVWADSHWIIDPRNHHAQVSLPRNATDAVAWIVCNLKDNHWDPVPEDELNEAERIIKNYCGENQSGRLYSRKWRKEWIITTYRWFRHKSERHRHNHVCRHHHH